MSLAQSLPQTLLEPLITFQCLGYLRLFENLIALFFHEDYRDIFHYDNSQARFLHLVFAASM